MFRHSIEPHEYGLLFKDGRCVGLLRPGTHRIWRPWRTRIQILNRLEVRVPPQWAALLLSDEAVREELRVFTLRTNQRALVWADDQLVCAVGAGRHVFWKQPRMLNVEVHDARACRLEHPRLQEIIRHADQTTLFSVVNVAANEQLLVRHESAPTEILGPGSYVFWQATGGLSWKIAARHEFAVEVEQIRRSPR